MLLKVKLRLNNGDIKEHVVDNVYRDDAGNMKLSIASTGALIHYKWDDVQKYECVKLNQHTLERLDE